MRNTSRLASNRACSQSSFPSNDTIRLGKRQQLAAFIFTALASMNCLAARGIAQETGTSNVVATATGKAGQPTSATSSGLDLLSLLISGGVFMIPIGILSLFVVMFIVERAIGLRRGWLYPNRLRKSILQFSKQMDADPRIVYQSCQEHPSAAASILKSTLTQVGRPLLEIKESVHELAQRAAERAYGNVRWLNFAAGVAPLLGLLGTVWGLIRAFHDTTQLTASQLSAGQNRADFLAVGIYEALVTTLAGLVVAIPAAVASHYFEGKITRTFDRLEEDLFDLLPKFESHEGVTRFDVIGREIAPRSASNTVHRSVPKKVLPPT